MADVDSVAKDLTQDATEQLKLIGEIKQESAASSSLPRSPPGQHSRTEPDAVFAPRLLGLAIDEVKKDEPDLAKQFVALRDNIDDLRGDMLNGDHADLEGPGENWASISSRSSGR